jgi:hypothetical protein
MFGINAESEDSPIRNYRVNVFKNSKKMPEFSKKQFPDKKFGNNIESPTFFKIDKIFDNKISQSVPYLENKQINKENNNVNKNDLLNKLNKFSPKQHRSITKNLQQNYFSDGYKYSNTNSNESN